MRRILRLLYSTRLAVGLFMALAAMSAFGTFFHSSGRETFFIRNLGVQWLPLARFVGLVDTYSSPLFLALVSLLSLTIVFCTWRRLAAGLRASKQLSTSDFWLLRLLDLIMHISIIVIVAGGAIKGVKGFIGTQYLFLDYAADTVYDTREKKDVPLGFAALMMEKKEIYYPLRIRIGVGINDTDEISGIMEVREGREAGLPGTDLKIEIMRFDMDAGWLWIKAKNHNEEKEIDLELKKGGKTTADFDRYSITLVAFRRDLKKVVSRVAVIDGGKKVKESVLSPNTWLRYRGISLFQTGWGVDQYGFPFITIQVARDPGAPIFWIGVALFCVTLPLYFAVRHRGQQNIKSRPFQEENDISENV